MPVCSVGKKMEPTYKKFREDMGLGLHRNTANSTSFQANM